jgi:hypothetical protein
MNQSEKLPAVRVDEDGFLYCPGCNDQYLHQREVEVGWRPEDGNAIRHVSSPAGIVEDRVPAAEITRGYRRDWIVMRFQCEYCGHGFELQIRQHKGQTILSWVKMPELPPAQDDVNVDQVAGDLLADLDF